MIDSIVHELESRWHTLVGRTGLEDTGRIFPRLIYDWNDPDRYYHNTKHLLFVLDQLDYIHRSGKIVPSDDLYLVYWAAWYHDVVEVPGRPIESIYGSVARMCEDLSTMGMSAHNLALIAGLIQSTEHHEPGDSLSAACLIDADLAIFRAPPFMYQEYVEDIRREHHRVSDEAWRVGRSLVLNRFLARSRIFTFSEDWQEELARENLEQELGTLT